MDKKSVYLIIGVVIVLLIALGVYFSNQTKDDEVIKIGVITPLTGWAAYWGEDVQSGINLAIDEINNAGGISGVPIVAIYEDLGAIDLKAASNAANKLVNVDNVDFVLPTFLEDTTIVSPIAHEKNKIIISIAAGNKGVEQRELLFRVRPYTEDKNAFPKKSIEYFLPKGNNKPVVLYEQIQFYENYKNEIVSAWEERTGEKPATMAISGDVRTVLNKVKEGNYNLMYVSATTPTQIEVMRRSKELGLNISVIGAGELDPTHISVGSVTDGLILPYYKPSELVTFSQDYQEKYSHMASTSAEWAYDAIYVIAKSMKNKGMSTQEIANEMKKLSFEGASGLVEFDSDQNRIIDYDRIEILIKMNDSFVPIE